MRTFTEGNPLTDTTTTSPRLSEATPDLSARDRLVVTLLLISTFVVILNETIMGVAVPQLMKDLRITADAGQWLTAAFMLTMAVVIPITGFELLVVARVVQASGAAIMSSTRQLSVAR